MVNNGRFVLLVILIITLVFPVSSVFAEMDSSNLEELEQKLWENFTISNLQDFLRICAEEKGKDFAREKAKYYASLYPEEFYIVFNVLNYCDPFSEPEETIDAAQKVIQMLNIPPYTEDMEFPWEHNLINCAHAYLVSVYAYYQLGDEEQLIKCADWLVSYAGFSESRFRGALSAYSYVVGYFEENGNDEQALYYAKQTEALITKYEEEYPEAIKEILPAYEETIVPILKR